MENLRKKIVFIFAVLSVCVRVLPMTIGLTKNAKPLSIEAVKPCEMVANGSRVVLAVEKNVLTDLFVKGCGFSTTLSRYAGHYRGKKEYDDARKVYEALATQTVNRTMQAWAWVWLSALYDGGYAQPMGGGDIGGLNGNAASDYIIMAVEQNECPEVQAKAALRLGDIYEYGHMGERNFGVDFTSAFDCFLWAAGQTVDAEVQAEAWMRLGRFYWDGYRCVTKIDGKKAVDYFTKAAEQTVSASVQARAWLVLGNIYEEGCEGVKKDYARACEFYRKAAEQRTNLLVKNMALQHLA